MTKNIVLCFTLAMILGAITACSQQLIPNSQTQQTTSNNTQPAQDAVSAPSPQNTNEASGLPPPIVAPPSYGNRPLKPGEAPTQQVMPNGLPALSPLKGVNVDTLFAENLNNTDRRFDRLENVVKDMRKEFEVLKPAIVRLVAVESDIQKLVEQLEMMAAQEQNNNVLLPPQADNAQTPELQQPQQLSPQSNTQQKEAQQQPLNLRNSVPSVSRPNQRQSDISGIPNASSNSQKMPQPASARQEKPALSSPHVKNLRIGQHKDKIRLVLDLSEKTPYTVDLDQSENILLIELPDAKWGDQTTKTFSAKTPVLSAYEVETINGGKGSRLVIALKQSSSVMETDLIPPGVTPAYRLYIDLKR